MILAPKPMDALGRLGYHLFDLIFDKESLYVRPRHRCSHDVIQMRTAER